MALFFDKSELPKEGRSLTFSVLVTEGDTEMKKDGFILRRHGQLFSFLNECPHWSVDLDLGDGHFYDEESDRIYCKNHAALFVLPSGECETGPCRGRFLTQFKIIILANGAEVELKPPYSALPESKTE